MEKPKSPKKQVATYIIDAHGTMLTTNFGDSDSLIVTKKYHAITIPEDVELYTFNNLGKSVAPINGESNMICKTDLDKYKTRLIKSINPAFKFIHEYGKENKFPELFLTPDKATPVQFYSGITHCIPENLRTRGAREKELIYNIDAKNTKNCEYASIVSNSICSPYNCHKTYSTYYKEQLMGYKYDPSAPYYSINKCGPILLSEALKLIQTHCEIYYGSSCVIKIYIIACLTETDLLRIRTGSKALYLYTADELKQDQPIFSSANALFNIAPNTPNSEDKTYIKKLIASADLHLIKPTVSEEEKQKKKQKQINLMEHYYEVSKHNTFNKVNFQNVVESLDDFKAIMLTKPSFTIHIYMYRNKEFRIKTFNGAFIEFNKLEVTKPELTEKLETSSRGRIKQKLDNYVRNALYKFDNADDDDDLYSTHDFTNTNELDILPRTNEINLAFPFNITSPFDLSDVIYKQLKELIQLAQQRQARGHQYRKKTLRKKRKKPKKNNTLRN